MRKKANEEDRKRGLIRESSKKYLYEETTKKMAKANFKGWCFICRVYWGLEHYFVFAQMGNQ